MDYRLVPVEDDDRAPSPQHVQSSKGPRRVFALLILGAVGLLLVTLRGGFAVGGSTPSAVLLEADGDLKADTGMKCVCEAGYEPDPATDLTKCRDINACTTTAVAGCTTNAKCTDSPAPSTDYTCTPNPGYQQTDDKHSVVPVQCSPLNIPDSDTTTNVVLKTGDKKMVTCANGYIAQGQAVPSFEVECTGQQVGQSVLTGTKVCVPVPCSQVTVANSNRKDFSLNPGQEAIVSCLAGYETSTPTYTGKYGKFTGSWWMAIGTYPMRMDISDNLVEMTIWNGILDLNDWKAMFNDDRTAKNKNGATVILFPLTNLAAKIDGDRLYIATVGGQCAGSEEAPCFEMTMGADGVARGKFGAYGGAHGLTQPGLIQCLEKFGETMCFPHPKTGASTTTTTGADQQVTCLSGYAANGSPAFVATCTGTAPGVVAWTNHEKTCDPVNCEPLLVANSNAANIVKKTGESVSVKCNLGYKTTDGTSFIAKCEGTVPASSKFTGVKTCEPILCQQLSVPNSDTTNLVEGPGFKRTVRCQAGFQTAAGTCSFESTCTGAEGSSSWTNVQQCNGVSCPEMELANTKGGTRAVGTTGASVAVECLDGYSVSGGHCESWTLECKASTTCGKSEWTPADYKCEKEQAATCAANQHVSNKVCVNCPAGQTRAAGDNPLGSDTSCTTTR